MSKKDKLPWSYRPGDERAARIREYYLREEVVRSEAIHRLLDIALEAEGIPRPGEQAPNLGESLRRAASERASKWTV